MKQFLAFVKKEFLHVFRDRKTLLILFGLPVAQIVLFGFALSMEVKNSRVAVVDYASDAASRELIERIGASRYFDVDMILKSTAEADAAFRKGVIKAVVVFPPHMESSLRHENSAAVQIIVDASDPNTGTTIGQYLSAIFADYQAEVLAPEKMPYRITAEVKMLYNPELRGAPTFVPGVMSLVLMLVCVMMTSISIVREKELGTMEILLVSPFRPILVILAKAVPYLLVSFVNLIIILLLSVYALGLPVNGSIALLISVSMVFIVTALALGLLISTVTASQQTAMLLSLMGMMLPTIIFSGFMFPIENMPLPLQVLSNIVPAKWYYIIVKSIMIKGVGIAYIWREVVILAGMSVFLLGMSLRNFKTRLV